MGAQSLISSDNYSFGKDNKTISASNNTRFVENIGVGKIKCQGRIIEVDHQDLFYSKFHKLINSMFRGEAYQFGHQTSEYLIRVEELGEVYSTQSLDFFLYGNYMGRLVVGDEVEIIAKERRGKRIGIQLFNVTTRSQIRPGIQLSANVVRVAVAFILFIIYLLGSYFIGYINSNAGSNFVSITVIIVSGIVFAKRWVRRKFFKRK